VSAAIVNQLARRRPTEMRALVKAGEELRKAQRGAVSGGDAEALRAATRAHRDLLDELTALARQELGAGGQTLPRVAQTLRAASIDKQASKALLEGTLSADVEQAGFGPILSEVPAPTGRKARSRPAKQPAQAKQKARKPPDRTREQAAKLREQLREARGTAREERRRADAASREAERAQKSAEKAEADVSDLEAQLEAISKR
jgi:hypothetical protein